MFYVLSRVEYLLQKEHLAIRERKKPDEPLDCNDLKSMRFTRAVRIVCHLGYII